MPDRSDRLARLADEDLMALVADTDADAFEVVYDRHADAAFALAHRILGTPAAADDACQDAWIGRLALRRLALRRAGRQRAVVAAHDRPPSRDRPRSPADEAA